MPNLKQAGRLMQFSSTLGQDELLILRLDGSEAMSQLFSFQIDLLADSGAEIDPTKIIGTKATVALALLDVSGTRYFSGLVAEFEQTSGDDIFDFYRAKLVPSLWQLTLSSNCRVFQSKTPMDIIKEVISLYGLSVTDVTTAQYPPLDYCTQYSETDFAFISRIAEQFGIFYWFEHKDGDNTVVFGDDRSAYSPCPAVSNVMYLPQGRDSQEMYQSQVSDLRAVAAMVTGKHTVRDYDYRTAAAHPSGPLTSAHENGKNAFERYEYPTGEAGHVKLLEKPLTSVNHGATMLTAQRDASDIAANHFRGVSSARTFLPGFTFTVTDHPREPWNRAYLLMQVTHRAEQMPPYIGSSSYKPEPYVNHFTAIESNRIFRALATTPKPRIPGPQTATVVTPEGEVLFVDKLGRVCVQFVWDRERKPNTVDNTWVRVAQQWAGNGWGTFHWPRGGDEVLVQFMNGDPDAPVVVGSVYNGVNVPKYPHPDHSTRTGIVTRSMNGTAANANELRFEDKQGSEEVYINAEKDMNINVESSHSKTVGTDDNTTVGGSNSRIAQKDDSVNIGGTRTISVTGDLKTSVAGNRGTRMTGNSALLVEGDSDVAVQSTSRESVGLNAFHTFSKDLTESVGGNYCLAVESQMVTDAYTYQVTSGTAYIRGGQQIVIESDGVICLKGPGGFISIDATGVTISGTMVMINSGGAATSANRLPLTNPVAPMLEEVPPPAKPPPAQPDPQRS